MSTAWMWKLAWKMAMKSFLKSILGTIVQRCQDFILREVTVMLTLKGATKEPCFLRWWPRTPFFATLKRAYAVLFPFTLTAKFKWEILKATNLVYVKTFMIDWRTKRLTASKDQIYLMDWVIYQSAILVCRIIFILIRMSDDESYLVLTSINLKCFITLRSTDCCLFSTLSQPTRELHSKTRGTSSQPTRTWKLRNHWTNAWSSIESACSFTIEYRH